MERTPPTTSRTLLVVDDEASIRRAIARTLDGEPYRILEASSGEQALALLARETVHVITCDQHMPGMDGVSLLQRVRRLHPNIVRLMLTSDEQPSTFTTAVGDAEVRRFLHKPWTDEQLRGALRLAFGLPAFGPIPDAPHRA